MGSAPLDAIRELLSRCSPEDEVELLRELRARHPIHEFERAIGAPAEMILEALHRAPELTRRMLRGVIADAAFRTFVVKALEPHGWRDVTPEGNFAFDYKVDDGAGPVTVQVKLQRSERGAPVVKDGRRFGFAGEIFMTETQKTRTGTDGEDNQTRPYRYGEFDILAVSMQPSTGKWDRFMYALGRWLLAGKKPGEMATLQPVSKAPDGWWTDDFRVAAQWLRTDDAGKRLTQATAAPKRRAAKVAGRKKVTG
ncbi:MAG: hypothetical protein KGZ61_05510 [Sandarakinorhabdus sp.]|nr:hypothetical protein [Sandarakinorhabdus sp.]